MMSIAAPGLGIFFQIQISHPYIASGFSPWEMTMQLSCILKLPQILHPPSERDSTLHYSILDILLFILTGSVEPFRGFQLVQNGTAGADSNDRRLIMPGDRIKGQNHRRQNNMQQPAERQECNKNTGQGGMYIPAISVNITQCSWI